MLSSVVLGQRADCHMAWTSTGGYSDSTSSLALGVRETSVWTQPGGALRYMPSHKHEETELVQHTGPTWVDDTVFFVWFPKPGVVLAASEVAEAVHEEAAKADLVVKHANGKTEAMLELRAKGRQAAAESFFLSDGVRTMELSDGRMLRIVQQCRHFGCRQRQLDPCSQRSVRGVMPRWAP